MKRSKKNIIDEPKLIPYKVAVKLLGRIYKGEGETLEEAINSIKIGGVKGAAALTVEHIDTKKVKIISGSHIKHLFGTASPIMKQISMKWVKQLFK